MNLHIFNFEIFKNPQKFQKKNYKKIDKKQKFQEMGRRPVRARCHWSNISNEFVHVPLRFFFFNEGKKKGPAAAIVVLERDVVPTLWRENHSIFVLLAGTVLVKKRVPYPRIECTRPTHTHQKREPILLCWVSTLSGLSGPCAG